MKKGELHPRLEKRLAFELVRMYHGEEKALLSQERF